MKKASARKGASKAAVVKEAPKKAPAGGKASATGDATKLIDARIRELGDWRGETLAGLRVLIKRALPDVVEEWKWDLPVWSCAGILCTGETYKNTVKLTFAKGASVPDPAGLFNSSLEGNTRRAIDFREGGGIDGKAFTALIRAAAEVNKAARGGKTASHSRGASGEKDGEARRTRAGVRRLGEPRNSASAPGSARA